MNDNVAQLRARWTAESTAAAIRFLLGEPGDAPPLIEFGGKQQFDLRGIRIEQAQFDAVVIKNVNLRWASFRDVGFKGAQLVKCNLSQVGFFDCYFRRAQFERCDFVSARFETCDFSNARIQTSRVDFATFRNCEITLANMVFRDDARPESLGRLCRILKLNAMSMGHYSDAGDLAYLEKTYDRLSLYRQAFRAGGDRPGGRLKAGAGWLASLALNWIWGYGEKPERLLLAITAAVFAFGTLQYELGAVPGNGWWAHVYFSGITFLTIGYGDLVPVGPLARLVAVVEGATGIAFLGLLTASATKKIMYR